MSPTAEISIRRLRPVDVTRAAFQNNLEQVRSLLASGVRGNVQCVHWAAFCGNLDMVRCLRDYGIHGTTESANQAAAKGHMHVLQDFRKHAIHATTAGANDAAYWFNMYPHGHARRGPLFSVVCDLWNHGVRATKHIARELIVCVLADERRAARDPHFRTNFEEFIPRTFRDAPHRIK